MRIARFCGQIVLIGCVKLGRRGGGAVENPENFADVLYLWSLIEAFSEADTSQFESSMRFPSCCQSEMEFFSAIDSIINNFTDVSYRVANASLSEAFSDVQPGATTPLGADISQFESSMRFPS